MKDDSFADHSAELTPEQARLAGKMESLMDEMEHKVFDAASKLNGTQDIQTKEFPYEATDNVVKVARGNVVEKCGFLRAMVKKELPPMMPEPLFNRYMQIDIYPKTPLVGMLHIAMNFSYNKDGSSMVGGIMDITPGTVIDEDLDFVKDQLDKLFAKHELDIAPFRQPLLKGHHKDLLKASCVGVSFFKMPFFEIDEKNFTLIKESVETIFDAYLQVLTKRKDQEFDDNDIAAMFDMRKRWLEKQFMWDPFASTGLAPYEVWSFQDLPPEVRF
jgi:coproporphyrinogen III oxidase